MFRMNHVLVGAVTLGVSIASALAASPSAPGAAVAIESPADGTVVASPVKVKFGVRGMEVAPAGTVRENSGHHHLIVDRDLPPLDKPAPSDANHLHYGKGQTEAELQLPPDRHTLQLLFADHAHVPHQPAVMSKKNTIEVK